MFVFNIMTKIMGDFLMKFVEKVNFGLKKNWLNFGNDPENVRLWLIYILNINVFSARVLLTC